MPVPLQQTQSPISMPPSPGMRVSCSLHEGEADETSLLVQCCFHGPPACPARLPIFSSRVPMVHRGKTSWLSLRRAAVARLTSHQSRDLVTAELACWASRQDPQRPHLRRPGSEAACLRSSQVKSRHVTSRQVKSSQVTSRHVTSRQVNSSQLKSTQVNNNNTNSSQLKSLKSTQVMT